MDSLKALDDAAGSGEDVRPPATQTPNDHGRLASAAEDQSSIAGAPKLSTEPKLPARDATVDQVREWIVATLVTSHKKSPEFARQISLKWELRRGWCLRELRPAEFLEMFGSIGPHLEWDVKYGMEKELAASNAKMKHASDAASRKVIALMVTGLLLTLAVYDITESVHYATVVLLAFHVCIILHLSHAELIFIGCFLLIPTVTITFASGGANASGKSRTGPVPFDSKVNVS